MWSQDYFENRIACTYTNIVSVTYSLEIYIYTEFLPKYLPCWTLVVFNVSKSFALIHTYHIHAYIGCYIYNFSFNRHTETIRYHLD